MAAVVTLVLGISVMFVLKSLYHNRTMKAVNFIHVKCRNAIYPQIGVSRFPVPESLVPWAAKFDEYKPTSYESPAIRGKPWADPNISTT